MKKKIKQKFKKYKRKYDDRMKRFWDFKLNPITGWRKIKDKKQSIVEDGIMLKPDQSVIYKPRGFH